MVKNLPDADSIPGLGRSPGGGNSTPLQYSYLWNLMDRGAWWATVHGWGCKRVRHDLMTKQEEEKKSSASRIIRKSIWKSWLYNLSTSHLSLLFKAKTSKGLSGSLSLPPPHLEKYVKKLLHLKTQSRNFLSGSVAKTLYSQCRGPEFHPWSGN